MPYYVDGGPRSGTLDAPDDQLRFATYHEAQAALARGGCWQGVDLDNLAANGLSDLANALQGYVEKSPSGKGCHAIGYGRQFATLPSNKSGVEAYAGGRFFTVTECMIRDAPLICLADVVQRDLTPIHDKGTTKQRAAANDETGETVHPQLFIDLRAALAYIRSDSRGDWIRIGHALKTLGEPGRPLWIEWSRTSTAWQPEDAHQWDTFNPTATGYGAVFAEAQRNGWINPHPTGVYNSKKDVEHGKSVTDAIRANQPIGVTYTGEHQILEEATGKGDDGWIIRIDDLFTSPAPQPEFLVAEWMPAGVVTLFSGHGGTGKTLLLLILATHIAAGNPFFGKQVVQAPVIFFSGEDAAHIIRFRLKKICEYFNFDPAEVAELLTVVDATEDPTLFHEVAAGKERKLDLTAVYARLKKLGDRVGARYFLIDNASDTYDGNENVRREVRHFIRELRHLGTEREAGVLLAAHVDKQSAMAEGRGGRQAYSGNTAWHNSVKSRLLVAPPPKDRDEPDDGTPSPYLVIEQQKSNYGRLAEPVTLMWNMDGLLDVVGAGNVAVARELREADDLDLLLKVVRGVIEQGQDIPTALSGGRTSYHVLSTHADLPKGWKPRRVNNLLLTAQEQGKIRRENYKNRSRHEGERWALT